MFEYFFLIIWHVGKPKKPKKGTLKILPENPNPPPGSPLWAVARGRMRAQACWGLVRSLLIKVNAMIFFILIFVFGIVS